jgi:hypothetical protein
MKIRIRNKWTSARRWVGWMVLPVFLLLAATAQAGDLSDPGIGPTAGTGASRFDRVGTSTAGGPATLKGANFSPEASIGGVEPAARPATGEGTDPGSQPAGVSALEQPPAGSGGADPGADAGGHLRTSLEGSEVTTNASDARMMVTTQLTEAIGPALKAVRATAFAAIDYLRAHLHESPSETIRGWTTATGTGTNGAASGIKHENGELGPASGGAPPAPEASTDQLRTHQTAADTSRPENEPPVSSSVNTGLAAGLGSAAQILIPIGLAAAVCGFAAPAVRRRLSPRAGWLRSALLGSSLEQPG